MNLIRRLLKLIGTGNVSVSIDKNGNLFLVGEFTLPIKKQNAERIFGGGFSSDPNNGLFPIDESGKKICLSVMPDDVAKIVLTKEHVSAIKRALSI